MTKKIISYAFPLITGAFTVALGVNNYDAGVYADTHHLNGASVGWFAPYGVALFALSAAFTILYTLYVIIRTRNKD